MFTPLQGKAHTKTYLKDKEYRKQYKEWKSNKEQSLINELSKHTSFSFTHNNILHMVTPSTYEQGKLQLTYFINNEPHSHETHGNLTELINKHFTAFSNMNLQEAI